MDKIHGEQNMKTQTLIAAILMMGLFLTASGKEHQNETNRARVYNAPENVCPVLVGTTIPKATLQDVDADSVPLMDRVSQKPTVLIFYRGGWCMYCNRQLGQLNEIEKDILDAGFQIVAVSPDKPAEMQNTYNKHDMNYTLLSDSTAEAATAFGIAFRVDDPTLEKLKNYKIDINAASGHDHNILPVPAVFVLDTKGTILFEYVNPVYSTRLHPSVLLAAVKAASSDAQ